MALILGGLCAAILAGFGPVAGGLSVASVGGSLLAAVIMSWIGGVVLQTRWLAPILFSLPIALGLVFAAISNQWWRCVALAACMATPFVVVGQFKFDRRRIDHRGM